MVPNRAGFNGWLDYTVKGEDTRLQRSLNCPNHACMQQEELTIHQNQQDLVVTWRFRQISSLHVDDRFFKRLHYKNGYSAATNSQKPGPNTTGVQRRVHFPRNIEKATLFMMAIVSRRVLHLLQVVLLLTVTSTASYHSNQCDNKKGLGTAACSASPTVASSIPGVNESAFQPTPPALCTTNSPLPTRSFIPPEPKGPEETNTATLYNDELRLEVLVRGNTASDAGKRSERSWKVQGLNVTILSDSQRYGSESLQVLLEQRRHEASLVLMFIDNQYVPGVVYEGCALSPV